MWHVWENFAHLNFIGGGHNKRKTCKCTHFKFKTKDKFSKMCVMNTKIIVKILKSE